MTSLAPYFLRRIGRSLPWAYDSPTVRFNVPHRKEYSVVPRGVSKDILHATVTCNELDREGRRTNKVLVQFDPVSVSLVGLDKEEDALEDVARKADPGYFANFPAPVRDVAVAAGDELDRRIAALSAPENRPADSGEPHPASVARLRAYMSSNPFVSLPDLFTDREGTVRARWMNGADKSLFLNFPAEGPLGASLKIPKVGDYGMVSMRFRCVDDKDVMAIAGMLGVKCLRG